MEVKPGRAVSIIECDMNVEFDVPEGYVEPNTNATSSSNAVVGFACYNFSCSNEVLEERNFIDLK